MGLFSLVSRIVKITSSPDINVSSWTQWSFLDGKKKCWISTATTSDKGAAALAEALKENQSLQELRLRDNKISDEGAKALAKELKVNTALQKLYLESNNISDKGAKALAEALKVNTALRKLRLTPTTYQPKAQRRWRRR